MNETDTRIAIESNPEKTPGGSRLTRKGRATRERIIDVTADLILERGVAHTSLEEVQERASVSASQLYHYFADKDALVYAVIDRQREVVIGFQRHLLDGLDSFEKLEAWRDAIIEAQEQRDCSGGCPLGSLVGEIAEIDPMGRSALARSFDIWEEVIRTGLASMRDRGVLRADADPDRLAMMVLATLQGALLLTQAQRSPAPLSIALTGAIDYLRTFAADPAN